VVIAYTNFNQAGSALAGDPRGFRSAPRTGRFSSSSPKDDPNRTGFGNLTNQPRDIRAVFVAPEGHDFFSFDYSGLELHIAAARSRDPLMLRTLGEGGDLHGAFQQRIIELTGVDPGRPVAKAGNFEQLYGGGADKLVSILAIQRAFIDYETAKIVVQAHHDAFTGYHAYTARVIEEARANGGRARTILGRMRQETDIFSPDFERRGWAERALVNQTVQGTAADIVKTAMNWSVPILRKYGAHLSIQVHDELVGNVPSENAAPFTAAMKTLMAAVPLPGLRLKVEGGTGRNWQEVH
jgi:DNA polymerase-1